MRLYHATPAKNLSSILRAGLLTSRSKGRLPVVWLCSAAKTGWALLHTVKRHRGRIESVVVLQVDVNRRSLSKNRRSLWYSTADVSTDSSVRVLTFGEIASSPVSSASN